jgi:hypothetical protein
MPDKDLLSFSKVVSKTKLKESLNKTKKSNDKLNHIDYTGRDLLAENEVGTSDNFEDDGFYSGRKNSHLISNMGNHLKNVANVVTAVKKLNHISKNDKNRSNKHDDLTIAGVDTTLVDQPIN